MGLRINRGPSLPPFEDAYKRVNNIKSKFIRNQYSPHTKRGELNSFEKQFLRSIGLTVFKKRVKNGRNVKYFPRRTL